MSAADEDRPERTLPVAALLILAAGMLDAYTYVGYGGVFANAMTGNIVKLTAALAQASSPDQGWRALPFVTPILAYLIGVGVAHALKEPPLRRLIPSAARVSLAVEVVFLFCVALLPEHIAPDMAVVAGIAFVAALQATSFTRIGHLFYTSVTTSGNLRHFAESFMAAFVFRRGGPAPQKKQRREALFFFTLCASFVLGALIGAVATARLHHPAVWLPLIVLTAALALCLPWNESIRRLFAEDR
ncbi:MAG: YoaK family protein [Asticcacaulis sp.]|uniref:YoaK family protein n=1 Tax=Asticcacaulis sp. TaxID=1872648 RepID=UPI003F7C4C4A